MTLVWRRTRSVAVAEAGRDTWWLESRGRRTFRPINALVRVDLPTLGTPRTATSSTRPPPSGWMTVSFDTPDNPPCVDGPLPSQRTPGCCPSDPEAGEVRSSSLRRPTSPFSSPLLFPGALHSDLDLCSRDPADRPNTTAAHPSRTHRIMPAQSEHLGAQSSSRRHTTAQRSPLVSLSVSVRRAIHSVCRTRCEHTSLGQSSVPSCAQRRST
jgi:hypothetical protein